MKFSREEDLLNKLVLNSMAVPDAIGLLWGQTGVVIAIATYARAKSKPELETVSDKLLDNVLTRASDIMDIRFASGLSGVCWGVEYLVQHGFMEGPAHDICENVDKAICKTDIRQIEDFSVESGLAGLWLYVWARIQGNLAAGLELPFSRGYLEIWAGLLLANADRFPAGAARRLEAAMAGELIEDKLSIAPFVAAGRKFDANDLSLQNGLAGLIVRKYVDLDTCDI